MAADHSFTPEPDLLERARGGDPAAFVELYDREAPGAWRLAVAVTRNPASAASAVAAGFAKVLGGSSPRTDVGHPVGPQLLAATREAAQGLDPAASTAATGPRPIAGVGSSVTMQAFTGLPERWRSVLWLTEAEGLDTAHAAAALRMRPEATEELATRARAGLRERFALAHLAVAGTEECERIATQLDAYATEELSIREANRVRRHLDGCDACRDRLAELDDLIPSLRRSALPLPETLAPMAEAAWVAAAADPAGPLHITLPSGRKVPAWVERTVAGVAAAVITLGITGAIVAGGRSKPRDDRLGRDAASDTPVGETALGEVGELPLVLPDGTPVPTFGGSGGSLRMAGGVRGAGEQARSLPGTTSTTTPPIASSGNSTTTTTTPGSPTTTTPPSSPTSPTSPISPTSPTSPLPSSPVPLSPVTPPIGEESEPAPAPAPTDPVVDVVEDTVEDVVGILDPLLGGTTDTTGGLLGS